MSIKYCVVEIYDGQLADTIFKFDEPLVALEVTRQLEEKNYGREYIVVVKDA